MSIKQLNPLRPRTAVWVASDGGISFTWYGWLRSLFETVSALQAAINPGLSVTITTAKLTAGGANGSMTFVNGVLTAQTPAT